MVYWLISYIRITGKIFKYYVCIAKNNFLQWLLLSIRPWCLIAQGTHHLYSRWLCFWIEVSKTDGCLHSNMCRFTQNILKKIKSSNFGLKKITKRENWLIKDYRHPFGLLSLIIAGLLGTQHWPCGSDKPQWQAWRFLVPLSLLNGKHPHIIAHDQRIRGWGWCRQCSEFALVPCLMSWQSRDELGIDASPFPRESQDL